MTRREIQAKYYLKDGEYGVDFHTERQTDHAVIRTITQEEQEFLVKAPMEEVRRIVKDILKSNP